MAFGALALLTCGTAAGQQSSDDPTSVCEKAARQAERDWHLPQGLLAAIGLVESGRRPPAGAFPIIWPWTINAERQGFYQPSKAAAVGMVRDLQRRGLSVIDVGCFQVDLFYHPHEFTSLNQAFDPDANARAAARILGLGRLGSTGWGGAIAAYHSAVPLFGAIYLQKVRAAWSWIVAHPAWGEGEPPEVYAVLLSPQARLIRIVTPFESRLTTSLDLPRVISADSAETVDRSGVAIQWLHVPPDGLPRVLTSSDSESRLTPDTTAMGQGR